MLNPRQVGGLNRAGVLRTLADSGPMARAELARRAAVSRASMGSIVQGLLDDGILVELDPVAGGIGKPATPVWFAPGAGTVVAVTLRRASVSGALVDARGEIGSVCDVALREARSADAVVAAACEVVDQVGRREGIIGVGIAVPGVCDSAEGAVLGSTAVPGAVGGRLVREVSAHCGLPTFVENDSRSQALAERWYGSGRGVDTFVSLEIGVGIGAGLVLDGELHLGTAGFAGEVGHLPLGPDGLACDCGLRGCWELTAGADWLRSRAAEDGLPGAERIDCARLTDLAGGGLPEAEALLDEFAGNLARGIAVLAQVLAPQLFVLHGDVRGGGEPFLRRLERSCHARMLEPVPLVLSALEHATLLGVAGRVIAERLHLAAAIDRAEPAGPVRRA